jgi:uncharacterized protein
MNAKNRDLLTTCMKLSDANHPKLRRAIAREPMTLDFTSCFLLSAAAFSGALVSGFAGFAFSAVAGSVLLRVFPPTEAVPLMMACSVGVQAASVWSLRQNLHWNGSLTLIIGGLLGIPIAVYLLQNAETRTFRVGFGMAVALYAAYMLSRPALTNLRQMQSSARNVLIGFGGGLIGGLTAMPGALPTIWCDMHGFSKNQQRGLVQPFIAAMQICALALLLSSHNISSHVLVDLAISVPALAAGTALGIVLFNRVDQLVFRRIILIILLFSGLSLGV